MMDLGMLSMISTRTSVPRTYLELHGLSVTLSWLWFWNKSEVYGAAESKLNSKLPHYGVKWTTCIVHAHKPAQLIMKAFE